MKGRRKQERMLEIESLSLTTLESELTGKLRKKRESRSMKGRRKQGKMLENESLSLRTLESELRE